MHRVHIIDVFSSTPFLGNPVAVVLDAEDLSTAQMQSIARWTNLSETTFVLKPTVPGADYRLRIFTPRSELPFAGHPTLGSAHAVLSAGVVKGGDQLVQECAAGHIVIIPSRTDGKTTYRLRLPQAATTTVSEPTVTELIEALGGQIDSSRNPLVINVGPKWLVAKLPTVDQLIAIAPDWDALGSLEMSLGITGVTLYAESALGIEVRSFAPSQGVAEDPVCGSGNGAVAIFRRLSGELQLGERYTAAQGQCVGRRGQIDVELGLDGEVWVGGACVTTLSGSFAR
ncbi:MAG: PhzF family phenazine biosynthesis protein [Steroidobacteraceae bacterium]